MKWIARCRLPAALVASAVVAGQGWAAQLLTRTLKEKPAIVLAAFGTSTRAQVTYDVLEKQVREAIPGYEIRWAFTSEVIRERVNRRWAEKGVETRLLSLQQVLANLEAEGYTKAVVQPLQVFPGEEYQEVLSIAGQFPGLRIEIGETMLQRWETLHEVVRIISHDFLPPEEGCNVLVAHGTPTTHVGSNITYLGLERYVTAKYPNVYLGAVEGVITREDGLGPAVRCAKKRVRFIPFMYVAGDHIMNDVMGGEGSDGLSWRAEVEEAGLSAETTTVEHGGETYFKGLGFFPGVNEIFIRDLRRALERF